MGGAKSRGTTGGGGRVLSIIGDGIGGSLIFSSSNLESGTSGGLSSGSGFFSGCVLCLNIFRHSSPVTLVLLHYYCTFQIAKLRFLMNTFLNTVLYKVDIH